jgi:hypothetical protein
VKVKSVDWKSYEQLAAKIFRKLQPEAIVTHDDSIYGHDSETKRQIDVSIRSNIAGRDILVIVQARDRKKAPDINAVGEFASVIRDVRADNGVMICRKPPGKNALTLAKKSGIEMCSAFDVNDRKWADDVAVPVKVLHVRRELFPAFTFGTPSQQTISLPPRPAPGFVSRDGGKMRTTLLAYMAQRVAANGINQTVDQIKIQDDELLILLNDIDWVPLPHLELAIRDSVRSLFRHCKAQEYLALMNHSKGQLTVAEMKLVLPQFNDRKAWREATTIQLYEEVAENVPIVDLQLSTVSRNGQYGFRTLPFADKANW